MGSLTNRRFKKIMIFEKAICVAQSLEAADKNTMKLKAGGSLTTIHRTGQHRQLPSKSCRFCDAEYEKCHKKRHLARVINRGRFRILLRRGGTGRIDCTVCKAHFVRN